MKQIQYEKSYEIDGNLNIRCEIFDQHRHVAALYNLLSERQYSISHQETVSEREHRAFCLSHPYLHWYVVLMDEEPVGAFYLTDQNSIGINLDDKSVLHADRILRFVIGTFLPLPAIPSVRPGHFYCNVSPENSRLIDAVKKIGGELSQVSYSFEKIDSA